MGKAVSTFMLGIQIKETQTYFKVKSKELNMKNFKENPLLPELEEFIKAGYSENFNVTNNGQLYCLTNPGKLYELHEVEIGQPIRLSIPATLFKITTKDGLFRGTLIDFEF